MAPPSSPGAHCTQGIISRLPYGQNNLGISESTAVALLCTLMELCMGSLDNCRYTHKYTHIHTHPLSTAVSCLVFSSFSGTSGSQVECVL